MTNRPGLQRSITLGLLGYILLLSMAVLLHGWLVNERAEALVWESLLETEMDYFADHAGDPGWQPRETGVLGFHDEASAAGIPGALATLEPGLHDELVVDGRETVVLVRRHGGRRLVLALDITELESAERKLGLMLLLSSLVVVTLLGVAVAWGSARLAKPLRELARRIGVLRPDTPGQSIDLPDNASAELGVIANALNAYLRRHDDFVERERAFIDSASHELRTPVAVIAGASELALSTDLPAHARMQLQRIERTARGVEELIAMLLVLAKDPAGLARGSDRIELDQLLPEIVDDHRHLCRDKSLVLNLASLPSCEIDAPVAVVQSAVGNLLRNAIENSDSGEITVSLTTAAMVVIEDPGHGLTPEQISAVYARQAREQGRGGGGIGLDLITRICAHLGWRLSIDPRAERRGTRATLDLGSSRTPQSSRPE